MSALRDRLLHRCRWCGGWRYGAQACAGCGDARPVAVDDPATSRSTSTTTRRTA